MTLAEAVDRAWNEALPGAPPDLAWDEAGGDSLALLHFVYRMEQLLGRVLPLDRVRTDLTRAGMVGALDEPAAVTIDAAGVTVFLLPGVNGDEPGLARFRAALADRMRFELIEQLPLEAPARLLTDMVAAGGAAADEIARRAPSGPLRLAGYSFGGGVALEAAAALIAAGREVALVAAFDTAFGNAVLGRPQFGWRRRWRRRVARVAAAVVAHDELRRLLTHAAERAGPRRAHFVRRYLTHWLRMRARLRWQPTPVAAPVWVALSDEFAPANAAAWARHYPHATVVRIPATHLSLIRGEGMPLLTQSFADAVAATREA